MDFLKDYPFLREISSPVTAEQLRPLDQKCKVVQFSSPLNNDDFQRLADFLTKYHHVKLRVYGHYKDPCDLNFLRFFPFVRRLAIDVLGLQDFSGIACASPDLEELALGQTKLKRHSLRFLERFLRLRTLYIEAHTKNIEVIGELAHLEDLTLRSITLPDLTILKPLKSLRSLDIKLGGTKNLDLLPEIGKLHYLELWMVRGLADLTPIASVSTLQYLFLQSLKNVRNLPSFAPLRALRRVHLETMKGLRDLRPVASAPALRDLVVADMGHLEPEAFRPFVGHPTLQQVIVGLCSVRKNNDAQKLLGLPQIKHSEPFDFLET